LHHDDEPRRIEHTLSTDGAVRVDGAACRPGPSPSSKATRLDGLRAESPGALEALLVAVGEPPYDIALPNDDPLVGLVQSTGFAPYARTVVVARRIDGFRKEPAPPGVKLEPYKNDWAEQFSAAEAAAMADFSFFREVGSPTGFETAEGWGTFYVARQGEEIVGFVQAEMPSGWINWIGVVPDQRRRGIGRALVGQVAIAVRDAVGSHIVAEVDDVPENLIFWEKQGFKQRTRTISLIRRV
jgi:ribosomal protein S18 acetylase RimI-like enzyme